MEYAIGIDEARGKDKSAAVLMRFDDSPISYSVLESASGSASTINRKIREWRKKYQVTKIYKER